MEHDIKIEYLKICPIDKKSASLKEIIDYEECEKDYLLHKKKFTDLIKGGSCNKLKEAEFLCKIENLLWEYEIFFKELTGFPLFSLQKYWAKRFLSGESFSITAPTGFGKTTFGITFSLFLASNLNFKPIYYIVPTKVLLNEIYDKFIQYNQKVNLKILAIRKTKDKDKFENNYDILITTSQFLHKNFEIIPKNFKLIYIDDADSMIRQPKNIDKVLMLIGFSENDINKALDIISKKRKGEFEEIKEIQKEINLKNKGQIIAASATLVPKTKRINLFKELLNFEIGLSSTFLRNIEDFYINLSNFNLNKLFKKSIDLIKKLGNGGLVFLSDDLSKDTLEKYLDFINKNNIKAISYEKFNNKNRILFEKGEIQVVVGFSNTRNPLTRGIDMPHVIRYAIFLGVPKFKLPLRVSFSPRNLFMLLLSLQKLLKEYKLEIDLIKEMVFLRKYSFMKEEEVIKNENIKNRIEKIKNKLESLLNTKEFIEKIKQDPDITLLVEDKNYFILIPDPRGYVQASGRTSRLFPLGLTQGLSILLVENEKIFENLKKKLNIIGYKINFKNYLEFENQLHNIIKKIEEDREIVKNIFKGEIKEFKDPIKTCLIIVESPTKARTISNFFGKPARRFFKNYPVYEVSIGDYIINIIATMGHFVDLVYNQGIYGIKKIDNEIIPIFEPLKICKKCKRHVSIDQNKCEVCGNMEFFDKEDLIEFLRKLANETQEVYLASDPDTEGEKISFDLFAYLYPYNKNIKRLRLHEITKEEFLKKFKTPENLDINLVKAQLTRRIADRWVGFYLSENLQRHFKNLNLSAGRVQTPVLGWIIKNQLERQRNKFYLIRVELENGFNCEFPTENRNLIKLIKKYRDNLSIKIEKISQEEKELAPPPPFQTSDLLKSAWDLLRFDAQTTMDLAQELFERGLITYHRTDSYYVSDLGKEIAKEYLEKYNFKDLIYSRSWGEPGTHECIRPTKPLSVDEIIEQSLLNQQEILSKKHFKLYEMILNRFLSSQMKSCKIKNEIYEFKLLLNNEEILQTKKEILVEILENGYNKLTQSLNPITVETGIFQIKDLKISRLPKVMPYTQATLIEEMKQKGLGRPSTYAIIIETLLERKYILINKGYLIPTKNGKLIYEYLVKKYPDFISEEFTSELEKKMDKIENNEVDYQKVLIDLFDKIFNRRGGRIG